MQTIQKNTIQTSNINIDFSRNTAKSIPYKGSILSYAKDEIGEMCEIGVYHLGYDFTLWFGMFSHSKCAEMFCNGDPIVAGGMTGKSLAMFVEEYYLGESRAFFPSGDPYSPFMFPDGIQIDKRYYNFGAHMVYLQWTLNIPFREIISWVPVSIALQISEKATNTSLESDEVFVLEMQQKMKDNRLELS